MVEAFPLMLLFCERAVIARNTVIRVSSIAYNTLETRNLQIFAVSVNFHLLTNP
jgi:hypothetical protein